MHGVLGARLCGPIGFVDALLNNLSLKGAIRKCVNGKDVQLIFDQKILEPYPLFWLCE